MAVKTLFNDNKALPSGEQFHYKGECLRKRGVEAIGWAISERTGERITRAFIMPIGAFVEYCDHVYGDNINELPPTEF